MRVPLSWLREYAPLPEPVDATEVPRIHLRRSCSGKPLHVHA